MNPEKEIYSHNFEKEKNELSIGEKRQLSEAWCGVVLGKEDCSQDIETMSNDGVKEWMYGSLMREIESLAKDWKLEPDEELINKIQEQQDLENKEKLEAEYIKKMHDKVSRIAKDFDMASADVHWSSWPQRMRETGKFNCVGATLIGTRFLDKAGIKSYYGSPAGHAINIAKLSNGEWWYADFLADKKWVKKFKPSETRVANVRTLKIDDKDNNFKLIPLLENSEAPSSILDNLSELQKEKITKNMPKEDADYILKFQEKFKDIDFGNLSYKLYPEVCALEESEEMKEEIERKRIAKLKSLDRIFNL